MIQRRKPLQRKTPLKRYSPKKTQKPANGGLLENYYNPAIAMSTWICEECGNFIPHSQRWQQIAAQCHIVPKDKFPSVALRLENRMHYCLGCHHDFDSSWDRASRMRSFKIAVQRFLSFCSFIAESETRHIPNNLSNAPITPLDHLDP